MINVGHSYLRMGHKKVIMSFVCMGRVFFFFSTVGVFLVNCEFYHREIWLNSFTGEPLMLISLGLSLECSDSPEKYLPIYCLEGIIICIPWEAEIKMQKVY